ncbi:uncharacterized protein LOC131804762 [Musca domestica]|uniref:Uncharacterized protein LOC131804762 n=1 Tax=Musca domestica TaxID=7370 RepID=A0ABM3VDP1_MUSDO|nr:uncharacterized protein LOC131804762 [Musca domestica]
MSQTPISSKQTLAFQSAKRTLTETSPDEMPGSSKKLVGNIQVSDLMNMMQKSMEGIMDEKLKNLATKSDFEDIKTNVAEIDKKCEDLKNENEILRSEINKLKAERERDNENLRRLVDQSKRKNVIFKGIKKQGSPKNSVENVCINVLKLNDLKIKMARTLYTNNGKIGVVAEMQTEEMIEIEEDQKSTFYAGLEERKSKDVEINTRGKNFIDFCYDHGLLITNGMTKGDECGEFTFVSTVGASVNDICAVSHNLLSNVDEFRIENKTWSDHMPIILSLNIKLQNEKETLNTLLPKLKWNANKASDYQNKVLELIEISGNQGTFTFSDVTNLIKDASKIFFKKTPNFAKNEKWFNTRCYNARKTSMKKLNRFRKDSTIENKRKYLESNRIYKDACRLAKLQYFSSLERKLDNVKDSKDWWKIAKEIRNDTNNQRGIFVEPNDFKRHFEKLLNPPQTSPDIQYAPNFFIDDDLDKPISMTELKNVLRKCKVNKAPGEDRIPYEFYKNAPEQLLQEILWHVSSKDDDDGDYNADDDDDAAAAQAVGILVGGI